MAAEQLRQNLLKETGITCWFPRYALPGAAASHEVCVQSTPIAIHASEPVAVPHSELNEARAGSPAQAKVPDDTRAKLGASAAADVLKQLKASTDVVPPPVAPIIDSNSAVIPNTHQAATRAQASAAQAQPQVTQHVVEPFGFSWFAIDKRLSVLAMLPPGASRLSSNCRVMLQRMLIALHEPWQSQGLEEQSFHWPFADDPDLAADANAARQAVEGFIARRLRVQHSAMLLVLSDQLPWFLQQSRSQAEEIAIGQLKIHRQYDLAMLCTYALHTMEQDAGLKRAAWQSMQVLRERLGRT
ncbi:MAG: hypothetical protein Q8S94_05745 [Pseudohongiella sp.]|nr:hypothetical protein [Pseudohongiella sp.]